MKLAKRVQNLPPYLFVGISRAIAKKKEEGIEVISFGIGDPDIPTPNTVLDRLKKASDNPVHHRYPESEGLPEFRQAVSKFYKDRFNVNLNYETEIINLIGAKEGIAHAPLCFIDPGDIALVPNPAYPVYEIGTMFAGGETVFVDLLEKNEFLKLALSGLISLLIIQTFIHIGVNIRLLPTTGMTLPFLSYGGSSLIGSAIIAGVILNFTKKDSSRKLTNE